MATKNHLTCEACGKTCKSEGGLKRHWATNLNCQAKRHKVTGIGPRFEVEVDKQNGTVEARKTVGNTKYIFQYRLDVPAGADTSDEEDTDSGIQYVDDEGDDPLENVANANENNNAVAQPEWVADDSKLQEFREYCFDATENRMRFPKNWVAAIKLLRMLAKKHASLDTYDDVMEWHFLQTGDLNEGAKLGDCYKYISRRKLIEELALRYNFIPKKGVELYNVTNVVLEGYGHGVDIVWHDAGKQVVSLLTDPRFTDKNFLHFNDDPLAPPPEDLSYYADINTGKAYIETYRQLITDPSTQMLMPIILYIDAAQAGSWQTLTVEALKMTLGIFTKETRDLEHAWRSLGQVSGYVSTDSKAKRKLKASGHIAGHRVKLLEGEGIFTEAPEFKNSRLKAKKDKGHGVRAFHEQLKIILASYKKLEEEGMYWEYPRYGKLFKVHMKFFILFIKCDGDEGDKLCLKYQSRNKGVKMLCRYCKCPTMMSNRVWANYRPKTEKEIGRLVEKGLAKNENAQVKLQNMSQHCVENAFHGLQFGLHNDMGIHGACLLDMLHAILLGMFTYIRDEFFEQMGPNSQCAEDINELAIIFGTLYARQADRDFPNTNFSKGLNTGRITGKEMGGILLVMATILQSQSGRAYLLGGYGNKLFKDERHIEDWAMLVELMLQWERFLCCDRMDKRVVERLEKKNRFIMYLIKRVLNKQKGMKLNVQKFHQIVHIATDIIRFGVPSCYDTSSNESHHKLAKIAAKLTQKDPKVFEKQTAKRLVEFLLLDLAWEEIQGRSLYHYFWGYDEPLEGDRTVYNLAGERIGAPAADDNMQGPDPEIFPDEDLKKAACGATLEVRSDEEGSPILTFADQRTEEFQEEQGNLTEYLINLQDKVNVHVGRLVIRTEHKRGGLIFHGHPNYRDKGSWKDWVLVEWGAGHGKCPAEIQCFVDLRAIPRGRRINLGVQSVDAGVYAVVLSGQYTDDFEARTYVSQIFSPITIDVQEWHSDGITPKKLQYYLANVESIADALCVVADVGTEDLPHAKNRYLQVKPRKRWAESFVKWVNRRHEEDHKDDDEEEDADLSDE